MSIREMCNRQQQWRTVVTEASRSINKIYVAEWNSWTVLGERSTQLELNLHSLAVSPSHHYWSYLSRSKCETCLSSPTAFLLTFAVVSLPVCVVISSA